MKNKLFLGIGCVVLAIFFVVGMNYLHYPKATFNGSRIRAEELYMLDFTILNGTQDHQMEFERDEQIHCEWTVERGTIDILIADKRGNKLYQGNNVQDADFIVTASQAGKYTITVTGDNAKGAICIQKVEK